MHVILTIDFSPWSAYSGGAQRSTHNLAKALVRRGHEVDVIFTKPPWERVAAPDDLPYRLHWAAFFDLKSRRNAPFRPLNALSVALQVARLLRPGKPAVVHSNGEEGGLVHLLRPGCRFGFVSTPRHPRYPQRLMDREPLSFGDYLRLALLEGKYLMQGSAARHADLCCPPSAFAADLVHTAYRIPVSRLKVIHNGVPEEFLAFAHRPASIPDGPLVFFGRFEHTKGVDTLVEALGLLSAEAPPSLIIGRGEDRAAILNRLQQLGLRDRVQVLPWMSHAELGETLAGASQVVLPSREENFSLAVLSAMAVGAPVVGSRVGGTGEIIEHEQTGLLVPPDDPQALRDAIARLHRHPDLARWLGQAGRDHVRQHFTWDVAAARFEEIYITLPEVIRNM